jgi:4-hydroxybenzoate polyprenyltransferase
MSGRLGAPRLGFRKWWVYQRERFPIVAHGLLIAVFSFSAVSFSALLRGTESVPSWPASVVACVNSFFAFLQLRLADEFKDFTEDLQFRPYRPVPRGLISLRELAWLWALTGLVQLALAIWLHPPLIGLLLLTWLYLGLMSREFFARHWLKARPVTYLWTHMLIMPLIDLYATACDWMPERGSIPAGLYWFLIVSFFNGMVIEIGRKIRAPVDEESGVDTYSVLWGRRRAALVWLSMLVVTGGCAVVAAARIDFAPVVAGTLTLMFLFAAVSTARFLGRPVAGAGKRFERLAGLWTVAMYLVLGAIPMCVRFLP